MRALIQVHWKCVNGSIEWRRVSLDANRSKTEVNADGAGFLVTDSIVLAVTA